jgi:hypothetical protein
MEVQRVTQISPARALVCIGLCGVFMISGSLGGASGGEFVGEMVRLGEIVSGTRGRVEAEYWTPGASCRINLEISEMGGFKVLRMLRAKDASVLAGPVNDVDGVSWVARDQIVFGVNNIYSEEPGLFLASCATGRITQVKLPSSVLTPESVGVVTLTKVTPGRPGVIQMCVDRTLYRVRTDGSRFRKIGRCEQ